MPIYVSYVKMTARGASELKETPQRLGEVAKWVQDAGGKIIGWEIMESRKGGGGMHQRIIWQCYDKDNYYYNFNVISHPDQFDAARAELQGLLNSIKFNR